MQLHAVAGCIRKLISQLQSSSKAITVLQMLNVLKAIEVFEKLLKYTARDISIKNYLRNTRVVTQTFQIRPLPWAS